MLGRTKVIQQVVNKLNIGVIYDTNIIINKYEMINGYGEIFSIINNHPNFYLLICQDILEEYYRTLLRTQGHSIHRIISFELEKLGSSKIQKEAGNYSLPKIQDTADQKFINCANSVKNPIIIVTTNIDDFKFHGSDKNKYPSFENNVVILPKIWLDEKERAKICEDLMDFESRSNMTSKKY